MPVIEIGRATCRERSLTMVAIETLLLKFRAGLNVTPASRALTSATAPEAVHTPPLKVDVTAPDWPVLQVPAAASAVDKVCVMAALSTSDATMPVRFSGVSTV